MHYLELFATIFCAVFASSGFWSYVRSKSAKKTNTDKLLLGLANQQLILSGEKYIERGSITMDEYRNFSEYVWEPYSNLGGNGLGAKIHEEIINLPIKG